MGQAVQRRKAIGWLFLVTLVWGGTFVWMKEVLNAADSYLSTWHLASVVAFLIVMRFTIGAISLSIFNKNARSGLKDIDAWNGGLVLGLLLWGGFLTQMLAIDDITPAVSAFLTSLYVVFTALIGLVLRKHPLSGTLVVGILLATLGAGFIDGSPQISWGWAELITVFSAFIFAVHIIATDVITKRVDPVRLTMTSFIVVILASTLTLVISLLLSPAGSTSIGDLFSLLLHWDIVLWLFLLGFLGSFIAILLLNIYQRFLHPVHAAIIYAFEPVWATIYALFVGLNEFTFWLFVGGGLLLLGNLIVELRPNQIIDGSEE